MGIYKWDGVMWYHRQRLIIKAKISLFKCGSENNSRGKAIRSNDLCMTFIVLLSHSLVTNRLAKTLWEEVTARGGLDPTINVCMWVPVHACVCLWECQESWPVVASFWKRCHLEGQMWKDWNVFRRDGTPRGVTWWAWAKKKGKMGRQWMKKKSQRNPLPHG